MYSGTDHPSERSTHSVRCGNQERNRLRPFFGFGGWRWREQSRAGILVELQAAEKDCLVLPEPFSSEFSSPSPETSAFAGNAEEQLLPKEIQDSELGDTLQEKRTLGLPLSPPSLPSYPRGKMVVAFTRYSMYLTL